MPTISITSNQVRYDNHSKTEEDKWEPIKPQCEYCREPIPLNIYLNDEYFPCCDTCVKHISYEED